MDSSLEIQAAFDATLPRYGELRGKTAVITGAAKGIGQGIAIRLAREGMRIMAADLDQAALSFTVSELQKLGVTIVGFHGDLSQADAISALFESTLESLQTVDLLVNNAADLQRARLLDDDAAELLEVQLATNIRGPYLCSRNAAAIMREAGGGNIIHLSSVGGIRAHDRGLPYDVTKGAIDAMTRAMAVDLADYQIRVNAVAPGVTNTYRTKAAVDSPAYQAMSARIPLHRFGTVADVSGMVAFLASAEADYITGQVMYVDGGITAQLAPPGQSL